MIILFDSLYSFTLHKHTAYNNNTIFFMIIIVTGEFTMLIQQKTFRVISFDFYSAHDKVYIHLPCINTQRQITALFDITNIISSSKLHTPRLYKGSADCCEGHSISDIIRLIEPSQTIHYCNQSILAIVPDLNIFGWSITIIDLTWKAPWYSYFLLRASYLYNLTGPKALQFWFVTRLTSDWLPLSWVSALYF